jgi:YidC/Oxa1 family membrane protein insertase
LSILQPFYDAVAWLVVHIHNLVTFAGPNWSWAIAIVLLTVFMRILLIPLFVKQIKSSRAMAALQPQMKALQQKYKNDKVKQQEEMQKLWREAGVNPLMGCLPLIPQIPIFIALFHTLDSLRPSLLTSAGATCKAVSATCTYQFKPIHEMTLAQVKAAAHAKIFGVPVAAAFNSPSDLLHFLSASATSTRVLCGVLAVFMVITTFITQRQVMARNTASGSAQMPGQQKFILYFLPLIFLVYGYRFPVGVLLYWLTTNLWSMGQQLIVLRRMDAATAAKTAVAPAAPSGPAPGVKPQPSKPKPVMPGSGAAALAMPNDGESSPARSGAPPPPRRPAGPGSNSNRRKRRRRR